MRLDVLDNAVPHLETNSINPPNVLVAGNGDRATALSGLLMHDGLGVTRVHDGWAALERVRQGSMDVAFLDQALPGLGGIEVCRLIKQDQATRLVPVMLFLSDFASREERLRGLEAGVDELVSAPADLAELKARILSLARVKRYTDGLEPAASVMTTLAALIEACDRYSEGHCLRMANYAAALGRRVGQTVKELEALRHGAFLHDIGMLTIPDALLLKPGPLDAQELALIRSHPVVGESLLSNLRGLQPVRTIVRHHHERRDGSGYPDGLRGDEIPLSAEIVGLVDMFEAMTSERPYQQARTTEEALDLIRHQAERGWHRKDLVNELVDLVRSASGAF